MQSETVQPKPKHMFVRDKLRVYIYPTQKEMAEAAANTAAEYLKHLLSKQEQARIILASAASQILFLSYLTARRDVPWDRVTIFHMDEYLGLPEAHPASFRRFIKKHVQERIPQATYHYIQGDAPEPLREYRRYSDLLNEAPIDLCCLGIGENGHIAFNDPHVAKFNDPMTVKIVQLDARCRQQQVNEGAFPDISSVPQYAYTISIPGLMRARRLIGVVPERRKAEAVRNTLEGPIAPSCPASILRTHANADLFLDQEAASLLTEIPTT